MHGSYDISPPPNATLKMHTEHSDWGLDGHSIYIEDCCVKRDDATLVSRDGGQWLWEGQGGEINIGCITDKRGSLLRPTTENHEPCIHNVACGW